MNESWMKETICNWKYYSLFYFTITLLAIPVTSTIDRDKENITSDYLVTNDYINDGEFEITFQVFDNETTDDELNPFETNFTSKINIVEEDATGKNIYEQSSLVEGKECFEKKCKEAKVISILGLFDLTNKLSVRPEGFTELAAAQLAVEHVNKHNVLPGYKIELYTNDTLCDSGVGIDRFFHALYTKKSTRMIMLLGTACSDVTESLAKIVPYWNMIQVSFGATSPALSDRSEYPFFFRTIQSDCSHNAARIAFLRKFDWNAVIVLSQNEERFSLSANELVTALEAANISCTTSLTFSERNYKEQLLHLKDLDTRIIIGNFEPQLLAKIFCEVYALGMIEGEYAWVVTSSTIDIMSPLPCYKKHLSEALEGVLFVSSYNHQMENDLPPFSNLTYGSFEKSLKEKNVSMSYNAAHVYDAVFAMTIAMRNAEHSWKNSNQSKRHTLLDYDYNRRDIAEELMTQFASLNFTGVSMSIVSISLQGPISFIGPNRVGTTAFQQIQNGTLKTLALYRGGENIWNCGECAIWRSGHMPVARSILRTLVILPASSARFIIATLSLAGVLLSLAFLIFNLQYAELRSIKLSSPRLTNMTLVGCVLVYSSVALLASETDFFSDDIPFSLICTTKIYLLAAGFSLAFGSMFAKTYRVHRIFICKYRGMCRTKLLRDTQLITLVCALLLIDGFIVTLWVTTDPMEKQLRNLTKEISSTDRSVVYQLQIEICRSHHMTLWLGSLYVYKGLLLIMGVYMAWETRHVKISALNDSKYIGMSVYCVVVTSAGAVVLENIISEKITLAFVVTSGLILLTTTGTLCLLFIPKLYDFFKNSDIDPVTQSMGLKVEYNTRRFVTNDPQEIYFRTEIQNKAYKKEIVALDKEINRLEKILFETQSSNTSSATSLFTKKHNADVGARKESQRIPSISGGLPMLLLSILPPVIPRASWPSAYSNIESEMRKSVNFSSQPKLFNDKRDVDNMLNKNLFQREKMVAPGLLERIRGFFGSKPVSRKNSNVSVSQNTNAEFDNTIRVKAEVATGIVNDHSSSVLSGPEINVIYTNDTSNNSSDDFNEILPFNPKVLSKSQSFEPKVHFNLSNNHGRKKATSYSLKVKSSGSPRFPHKLKQPDMNELRSSTPQGWLNESPVETVPDPLHPSPLQCEVDTDIVSALQTNESKFYFKFKDNTTKEKRQLECKITRRFKSQENTHIKELDSNQRRHSF